MKIYWPINLRALVPIFETSITSSNIDNVFSILKLMIIEEPLRESFLVGESFNVLSNPCFQLRLNFSKNSESTNLGCGKFCIQYILSTRSLTVPIYDIETKVAILIDSLELAVSKIFSSIQKSIILRTRPIYYCNKHTDFMETTVILGKICIYRTVIAN